MHGHHKFIKNKKLYFNKFILHRPISNEYTLINSTIFNKHKYTHQTYKKICNLCTVYTHKI